MRVIHRYGHATNLEIATMRVCVSPAYLPETGSMASASGDCHDGYKIAVDATARRALLISLPLSDAAYAICTRGAGLPMEQRVGPVLVQYLRRNSKLDCVAGSVTSAGYKAYRVSYSGCKPVQT
jgi:hypothetical protein